jgi:predicted O-methyltransferase YrrM
MTNGPLKRILKFGVRLTEIASLPLLLVSAGYFKLFRKIGVWRLPLTRDVMAQLGVFPLRDHYFDPLVTVSKLSHPLGDDRPLAAIDMNVGGQLDLLHQLHYESELRTCPAHVYGGETERHGPNQYFYGGDADYYYSLIRLKRPKRIVEIGSGYSTLIALSAIEANRNEDPAVRCTITCIEPFENPWLADEGVTVIRSKVEALNLDLFSSMEAGDILFIDSTHVIRAQGDVLFEYFQILPSLASGVLIHIHDIFTPKDYPEDSLLNDFRFFNEQYLVEAFLSFNASFRIVAALHFLYHTQFEALQAHLPHVERLPSSLRHRTPTSLWLERV